MRRSTFLLSTTTLLFAFGLGACDGSPSALDDEFERDMATIHQATSAYQQFDVAVADGFIPLSGCVASPAGAMGYHYGHPARIGDPTIDPASPEILLYAPTPGGGMQLVGVEFMVHHDAWHGAGNSAPPRVAGQDFDPPNPQHPDEAIREMYTLHVWNWVENPLGVFAHFNPVVSCG